MYVGYVLGFPVNIEQFIYDLAKSQSLKQLKDVTVISLKYENHQNPQLSIGIEARSITET